MSGLPRTLSRDQHSISRREISTACLKVLYTLKDAGHGAYLVGGAVRDLLLGGHPKDFDVATDATPEQVRQLFRSCRLVGRRFVIAHVRFSGEIIEVTTFRGHGGDDDAARETVNGQLKRDNVFGTIEEDAQRRDFTANALYYTISDFSVIDFLGALPDIEAKILRLIGEPESRYREDPVRMLRAARLKAKLGFTLSPETEAPIAKLKDLLDGIPPARLFDEFTKLFLAGHAVASLDELLRLGLMPVLFPRAFHGDEPRYDDALLRACLAMTDARVAEGRPVSAGFIVAAMGFAQAERRTLGKSPGPATADAIDAVFGELCAKVAIPRRFTAMAKEIIEMQSRFDSKTPGRVRRLLQHPRMRPAYDFYLLRSEINPDLLSNAQRWRKLVESAALQPEEGDQADLPEADLDDADESVQDADEPRKRRRRRRRTRPADASVTEV